MFKSLFLFLFILCSSYSIKIPFDAENMASIKLTLQKSPQVQNQGQPIVHSETLHMAATVKFLSACCGESPTTVIYSTHAHYGRKLSLKYIIIVGMCIYIRKAHYQTSLIKFLCNKAVCATKMYTITTTIQQVKLIKRKTINELVNPNFLSLLVCVNWNQILLLNTLYHFQ